jgi:parallel beta-helix repeat protein
MFAAVLGTRAARVGLAASTAVLLGGAAQAQPAGGSFGPVAQVYEVPAAAAHVYYVAPDGKPDVPGATPDAPTTVEAAIGKVVTGDAVIFRGGTYRVGGLELSQGVTLQPYRDEVPVLKGTRVAAKWEALRDGVWRTKWTTLFPQQPADWWQRAREGMRTPMHRFNNDMVFVDGEFLQSAGWEGGLDAHAYFIDYVGGYVYIGVDPKDRLVEITAWDSALVRTTRTVHGKANDHKGPVIKGLTFTQYAYRALEVEGLEPQGPAEPATFGKEIVGTVLENVTITFCSRVAGYFHGDGFVVRHCLISDTSTEGIYVIGSADVLLEDNIFRRNNIERITGYYPAAVKIFNQSYRVTCRHNLVTDQPYSNGIWYDVGNVDGVFVNNWVENAQNGFFFEISKGVVVAGNVFVNCDRGIHILNSSNAQVYQNTFVNAVATFERNPRSAANDHFGWHPATGPDVDARRGHVFVGNLLAAVDTYRRPLLSVEQAPVQCGKLTDSPLARIDGNVYVRQGDGVAGPAISWSPADGPACTARLASPADLAKAFPGFDAKGRLIGGRAGTFFLSPELKRYEPAVALPAAFTEDPVPDAVCKAAGWAPDASRQAGAYPRRAGQ